MTHKHKKIILITTSVADNFFSPNSRKKLTETGNLDGRIKDMIQQNADSIYGHIDLVQHNDRRKDIDIYEGIRPQKVIQVRTSSNKGLLLRDNEVAVMEEDHSMLRMRGDDLDHLLRPEEYEFHICGLDRHGVYKNLIQQLLEAQYKVYVYSDLVKRYKDTDSYIKSVRDRNLVYCSSQSALFNA